MTTIQHASIAEAYLHEPKGVSTALVDKVYVSDGAGSGAWQKIETDQLDAATITALTPGTTLIYAQDAASSSTIDFNQTNSAAAFNGTYDHLQLVMSNIKPASDDVEAWLRIGTGGTPTYQTSGYMYVAVTTGTGFGSPANVGSTSAAKIVLTRGVGTTDVGNASGEGFNMVLHFDQPDSTNFINFYGMGSYDTANSDFYLMNITGKYNTVGAVTAVRFLFESGNITSGHFALYGYDRA